MSIGSRSKPARAGAALSALLLLGAAARGPSSASPQRLAIYYGYPSLVNDARGDFDRAFAVFSEYDVLVLGDGLEVNGVEGVRGAGRREHAFTARLVRELAFEPHRTEVYGYIAIGLTQRLSMEEIARRMDGWVRLGAAGVLLDEAGYDFGVTRERQHAAIRAAHSRGLRAMINAFRPEDVFSAARVPVNETGGGNPTGLPPAITARDALLLESFAIRDGVPEEINSQIARMRAALDGRDRFGMRVFAISTGAGDGDTAPFTHYGWWNAAIFGLDAYGWGMPHFSAATSRLPWIARPDAERTLQWAQYLDEPLMDGAAWRRRTTAGTIVVDITGRRGALESR